MSNDVNTRHELPTPGRWDWTFVRALCPLLVLYVAVTLGRWPSRWEADEGRYLLFAQNLSHGGYALANDDFLVNGPGYPLVLAAWNATGLPTAWARFGNVGFLFLATVFFAHFMALYVPRRWALGLAWMLGLYVPLWNSLGMLMTESLAVCLVCGVFWTAARALRTGSLMAMLLSGLLFAWLALTKVFFGYVLIGGLVVYILASFIWRGQDAFRRMATIYLIGLLAASPYLVYTYHVTGKIFYWSSCGGRQLYLISTPYEEEWGDWFNPADVHQRPELARHRPFFDSIAKLHQLEKDDAMRRQAIENIKTHPAKFLKNVAANITRMCFSFPYSYTPQKLTTLFYMLPNAFLLSMLVVGAVALWARRPPGVGDCHLVAVFMALTFGGSALLCADPRMLYPIVPGILFLVGLAGHAVWEKDEG